MLDSSTTNSSISNVEEVGRRRSTFYIPLSESLDNYRPPSPQQSPPPPVYTPAPQRLLLRARKSLSRSSLSPTKDKSKVFNTFPTKAPPKNLGLTKCPSDIDFSEDSISTKMDKKTEINYKLTDKKDSANMNVNIINVNKDRDSTKIPTVANIRTNANNVNTMKEVPKLKSKLSLPANVVTGVDSTTSRSQNDLHSITLVKVQAMEIQVCKTPLKSTVSCHTPTSKPLVQKKERSFIGLTTSKSASRINLTPESSITTKSPKTSLLSTPKILKSNSKSNMSLLAALDSPKSDTGSREKSRTLPQDMIIRTPVKNSSIFSPSKTDDEKSRSNTPKSPGFSLIRRSHSTKLSRSNSLLKAFSKQEPEVIDIPITEIGESDYFKGLLKEFGEDNGRKDLIHALIYGTLVQGATEAGLLPLQTRKSAIRGCLYAEEEAVHSDTSYEKACRNTNGSGADPTGTNGSQNGGGVQAAGSPSRLAAFFFSKRSLRASPLKRARSAAKLAPRAPLRSSRSHESLLSSPLSCGGSVRGGAVRALHASLAGRPHCFLLQLPGPPASTRHFSCGSRIERDTWINSLRASLQAEGGNNVRRTERSLRLYLLEAKGLPPKKRYYCELLLDSTLYARTSSKLKTEMCFWGEVFEFSGLPQVGVISIDIYREPDRKPRKRDKRFLVGSVKIPIQELTGRHQSERWHPIELGSSSNTTVGGGGNNDTSMISSVVAGGATLRAKCKYQCLDVLPEKHYQPLLMYLRDHYSQLIEYLEPVINVKSKEEVAGALVGAVRCAGGAAATARLLAAAAALEVKRAPHAALAFRANSLATKATEAYMKMLGETYLQETLWECVSSAMSGGCGWEVDPGRGAGGGSQLRRQRGRLRGAVARTWGTLLHTRHTFPHDLTLCFAAFREKLRGMQREELTDHLVSASVFLRFLCPAILTPSLFGITHEYPDERAGRNLTLVAKTLQTLANFTRFQGKEAYMEFLNDFLEEEAPNMRSFLKDISTLPQGCENALNEEWGTGCPAGFLDLGKQLASLHILLADNIQRLPPQALQELDPLPSILDQLNQDLREYAGSQNDLHSPSSIHDNIFRFNDPTCNPSADTTMVHSSPLLGHGNNTQLNTLSSSGSGSQPDSTPSSLISHVVKKSPSLGVRAATLPRNNFNNVTNVNSNERYSSQYNNREHCVNLKVAQLGFDKNASTPSLANKINGSNGNIQMHSSHRSVTSNRSNVDGYGSTRNAFDNNYGSREHIFNSRNMEQNNSAMPKNLEELTDLLRYADDQEHEHRDDVNINQRITNHDILPQTTVNIISNGNSGHVHNNGSNVSISALSNVASSGYQSFATYSQSSSPVELYAGQQQGNYCDGSPAHRRPNQIAIDNRRNNYSKSNQQRFEYERQKFGIQNFTRDTGASSPRPLVSGPLTFTNPVYHIDGEQDPNENPQRAQVNRSMSTSSSSSIEEEDTTDNMETNSEENVTNYRNKPHSRRNVRTNEKPKTSMYADAIRHTKSSADSSNRKMVSKSRSTGSEPGSNNADKLDQHEPHAPLRRNANSRLPRTNPLSSYNQSKNNVIHFGQATDGYQNDRLNSSFNQNFNRPDSNVEETNKEMYRLQISRSQKALYDRNNLESFSNSNLPKLMEKYEGPGTKNQNDSYNIDGGKGNNFVKNNIEYSGPLRVMENGYPLERNYSSKNMSSTRLNEDLRTSNENGYPLERTFSSKLREDPNNPATLVGSAELAVRRLSLEGGPGGDSSSEPEDGSYPTVGRRRLPKNQRTIQQYEREIERLKCSVDKLRQKLESIEPDEPTAKGTDLADSKMKGIITRLLGVEEELRREQRAMTAVLNRKQRVIERQGQRLAALGAANARLLSALHQLQPDLITQPLVTSELSIIGQSEQLLNNLQADLRPLYESSHQHSRSVFEQKIPPYREPPPANYSSQLQIDPKEDSKKNDGDNNCLYSKDPSDHYDDLRKYQSDSMKKKSEAEKQRYGLDKSPSRQFYQDSKNNSHHVVYNTDKGYEKNSSQHQLFGSSDKSPNHQYYHDKNDNVHLNNVKNIERSASNQQLYLNRDVMPIRHSESGQHIAYQEKNMNDSDYRYQSDANRNSDPVTRSYRGPNIEITQQFVQQDRPMLPSEGHQSVVSTQPSIYYGNP